MISHACFSSSASLEMAPELTLMVGKERSILSSISMLFLIRNFSIRQTISCLELSSATSCEVSCTEVANNYNNQKQG